MARSSPVLTVACCLFAYSTLASGQDTPTKTCIALVLPSVQGVEGSATDAGNAVRDLLTSYLNGPSVQALALEARLRAQAIEEARQKQCPNVVIATLTRKQGGGGVLAKTLAGSAGTAAWSLPGGTTVGSAIARSTAIAGAQAAATLASSTKAKDEMRLEYTLLASDGAPRGGPRTQKARATADREDLLTPLVERAAADIVVRAGIK
jgi:hypothetical protein